MTHTKKLEFPYRVDGIEVSPPHKNGLIYYAFVLDGSAVIRTVYGLRPRGVRHRVERLARRLAPDPKSD